MHIQYIKSFLSIKFYVKILCENVVVEAKKVKV